MSGCHDYDTRHTSVHGSLSASIFVLIMPTPCHSLSYKIVMFGLIMTVMELARAHTDLDLDYVKKGTTVNKQMIDKNKYEGMACIE